MPLLTSVTAFDGGIDAEADIAGVTTVTFEGTWRECDRPLITITDSSGISYQFGVGETAALEPVYCFTYNDGMYVLLGASVFRSKIGEPTVFNDLNGVTNTSVVLSNYFAATESLVAMAAYQNKLAFFSENTIHIWVVDPAPEQWAAVQKLPNIGTKSPRSVQSLGDADVFFLAASGIRSLRAKDSSGNAMTQDLGSPIDDLIVAKLAECSADEVRNALGVIEPEHNRYWLFVKDTFYVYSFFPSSKVMAWSTYLPTYELAEEQTAFSPTGLVRVGGRVLLRDATGFYAYGGDDNDEYDTTVCEVELPWNALSAPATTKLFSAVDACVEGRWKIRGSSDYLEQQGELPTLLTTEKTTYDFMRIPFETRGTHFKLRAESVGEDSAELGSLVIHYNPETSKV
jgi:hypothetical protein